jgi:hypothetical protein
MSDFYQNVTSQQDIFRQLSSHIPGFSGYVERSNRRAADKLLRETVARRFNELYKRASALQTELVNAGRISYLDKLESAVIKIQTFMDKVATAAYGYAGFFDAVKINEAQLAKIYEYDMAFFNLADGINQALDNVEHSLMDDASLPAAIHNLTGLASDALQNYERRYEVINGAQ